MNSMSCWEFERIIIDFGSDQRALEHAQACARCAAQLKREQRMTAGLQALAAEEAAITAPERVRSALRAVFDEQQATAPARTVSYWSSRRKLLWGMAAAAMVLLSAVTTALLLREPRARVVATVAIEPSTTPQSPPGLSDQAPREIRSPGIAKSSPSTAPSTARGYSRRSKPKATESADNTGVLFPLTYVARSGPTEFVQTVRVEISRSTLLSMGVPVNLERGEGLIKADIIIGEDGVARAVRIIN
jgi:hypothetical protein